LLEDRDRLLTQGCCGLQHFTSSIVQASSSCQLVMITAWSCATGRRIESPCVAKRLFPPLPQTASSPSLPAQGSYTMASWHVLTTLVLWQGCTPARSKGLLACRSYSCLPLGRTKHFVLRGQDLLAHVLQLCSHRTQGIFGITLQRLRISQGEDNRHVVAQAPARCALMEATYNTAAQLQRVQSRQGLSKNVL